MDFDEYEYLEKSVEDPQIRKEKEHRYSRHHPEGEMDVGDRKYRELKRTRTDENGGAADRDHRDRSDRREKDYRRSGDKERERDRDHRERDREREKEKDKHREKEKEEERSRDRESEKERDRDREKERERSRRSSSSCRRQAIEHLRETERARSREMREQDERDSRESSLHLDLLYYETLGREFVC